MGLSYGDIIDFCIKKNKVVLMKSESQNDARQLEGIIKTKKKVSQADIDNAKNIALSKKWNKK